MGIHSCNDLTIELYGSVDSHNRLSGESYLDVCLGALLPQELDSVFPGQIDLIFRAVPRCHAIVAASYMADIEMLVIPFRRQDFSALVYGGTV